MNVILCSFPDISWGNIKPQTANMIQLPLILVLIIIWKVKWGGGTWDVCTGREQLLPGVTLMQQRHEDPCACTHVPIMSNFFPVHIPVCTHVQILFEKRGNLMVIVMNVDLADQKSRRRKKKKRKCGWILRGAEEGLFRCSGVVGFHEEEWFGGETWLFFPFCFFLVHRGVVCYKKAGRSLDTHH